MSNPTTTERITAAVAEHPGFTQPQLAVDGHEPQVM
jgi:hypothetical protein